MTVSRLTLVAVLFVSTTFVDAQDRGARLQDVLAGESEKSLADDAVRFGDAVVGAALFRQPEMNCVACHLPTENRRLGPNLAEKRAVTAEHLVQSVLHPSQAIHEGYETTLVLTVDGKSFSGVLVRENEDEILLDQIEQPDQPLKIRKADIDDRRKLEKSSMPDSLVNQLSNRQQFLNLIRYLYEIAEGGAPREKELAPADSLFALPPLPAYESDINHDKYIGSWNNDSFERGKEIYRLRCESCHGTVTQQGSLPTSLRFASGQFKNGNDPHSMYQTLTHGYGMMNPQRWMVPRQKYDVIHYIREHFLRNNNPSQYFDPVESYLAGLPKGESMGPIPVKYTPWSAMDYGPSLNNTVEVSDDRSNIAQKGIAIRLDSGPGGVESGKYWMLYDHDLMRVAAAWSDDFIDYNGIHFNGVHGRHPKVAGQLIYQNELLPGWGRPGSGDFQDNRLIGRDGRRYGPLSQEWLKYKGMYRFGQRTILSYQIGETDILESPSLNFVDDRALVTRHFQIGPREQDLVLQVAKIPGDPGPMAGKKCLVFGSSTDELTTSKHKKKDFSGERFLQCDNFPRKSSDFFEHDFSIVARINTTKDGTILAQTLDQSDWVPNGKTFFIRDGRLHFDVGWVGVVRSKLRVDPGKSTVVGMSWNAKTQQVTFFANGESEPCGRIQAKGKLENSVVRVGFTNDNFPSPSMFTGQIEKLALLDHCLGESFLDLGTIREPVLSWKLGIAEDANKFSWRSAKPNQPRLQAANTLVHTNLVSEKFEWIAGDRDNLRIRIKAGSEPLRFALNVASSGKRFEVDNNMLDSLAGASKDLDLERLTSGGPPNWPEKMTTTVKVDHSDGPFQVDVLTRPERNPWNDRLRFTGVDFAEEGNVAIVCCWDGTVYRVEGLEPGNEQLVWQRIAAGLFQPLGVKLVDEMIYVCCRDQIVRLNDLNGDQEIDFYENFNSDHQVTEHFHEFAMGLQTDDDGNFYYAKSARHALKAVVPHHGTLLRVDPNGESTRIIANGFRAANGVCLNQDGSFIVTDQEGHWNPKNRINWVREGGFYGNMFGYHDVEDDSDSAMEKPLCWITNAFDRSPAELLWVKSKQWGNLNGSLLNFSYGHGKVYIVPHEEIDGQMQGGMCELPLPEFPTGIMRGRFNPADGNLYGCGMFAWSGNRQQPGGFYRIRRTEEPVHLPLKIAASTDRLEIEFSDHLAKDSVSDVKNFKISCWDLKRSANYGSKHYNEKPLQIISASLKDGRTVLLDIDELAPTRGMSIDYSLQGLNGERVRGKIHNTIHQLAE